jgi:thioredoxin 1
MGVIECNKDNFDDVVLNSKKPVLVDFNAVWCGPCRMMGPVIEELANEKDDFVFASIDVDGEEELASKYGIVSIPCLIIFKDGKEVIRNVGFTPKDELLSMMGDI